jgi:hypothetical protein
MTRRDIPDILVTEALFLFFFAAHTQMQTAKKNKNNIFSITSITPISPSRTLPLHHH